MEIIEIECGDCRGTGLYSGMCEGPGLAVVCLRCEGTGCQKLRITRFTKRKAKSGIRTVRQSRGSFIGTGVGATGKEITYKEFSQSPQPLKLFDN